MDQHTLELLEHDEVAPDADGLRILLFGLPGAGKTSLRDTVGEAVRSAILEGDGRAAGELISHPDLLESSNQSATLVGELAHADALVLAVDASAPREQLDAEFTAFDGFLRQMEEGRSARADVGGLPVFLVLTKCDLMAAPGDCSLDWMERIEQRKREVDSRFRDFLARRATEMGPLPFGQLDLYLWATAVKRPELAGPAAQPSEPYGVAELFRQSFDSAAAYRQRCRRSNRRLHWTVSSAVSAIGALAILAIYFVSLPAAKPPSELQLSIEALQFAEKPTLAERLHAPSVELERRREKLGLLRNKPDFDELPEQHRRFVVSRYDELDKYLEWREQVQAVRRPVTVDTEAALREIKAQLEKLGSPLPEEWRDTEAARFYHERLDEVNALLDGVRRVQMEYLGDANRAWKLWSFEGYLDESGVNWRLWSADLEELRRQFKPANFKQTDKLPGAPALTYASVMRIDTVIDASTLRQRLDRVRDLCAALGLIGPIAGKPPLLVIDKPPAFNLSMSATRLQELQQAYPDYMTEFVRAGLPDALVREMDRAASTNYDFLLEPARSLVLSELKKASGGGETLAGWSAVRDWLLRDPPELAAWRSLALILLHLRDPAAPDSVTALTAFLQEKDFSLGIERISLELPDSIRAQVPSSAALSIYHPRTSGKEPALTFEQSGQPKRDPDRRVTVLSFELKKGNRIEYQPGDELYAKLPLSNNMQLTWTGSRSTMYQFECLQRPPWLHKADEPIASGQLVNGVRLTVSPTDGWPRVPDLLPRAVNEPQMNTDKRR